MSQDCTQTSVVLANQLVTEVVSLEASLAGREDTRVAPEVQVVDRLVVRRPVHCFLRCPLPTSLSTSIVVRIRSAFCFLELICLSVSQRSQSPLAARLAASSAAALAVAFRFTVRAVDDLQAISVACRAAIK